MPGTEPLSPPTLVAIGALLASVVALWVRPWWLWGAAAAAAVVAGYGAGVLDGPAGLTLLLLAFALDRSRAATGWRRGAYGVLATAVLLALGIHAAPGFANPVVIRGAVLSPGAARYTQFANFDKGLAGVIVLGTLGLASLRSVRDWSAALRRAAPIVVTTIALALAASLALGFVRFDPRWTPLFWAWAPVNLLLTCASEEAFFRGFLQREVERAADGCRHGAHLAVACSALAFGLAHAAGGWRYVLLSTLAGTGYALASQRTGRVEMAILAHFAVNATHFLLFTYPARA